jgi:hypothetical protein
MATDLHERLLAVIGQHGGPLGTGAALRAVVELHAPEPCNYSHCRNPDTHRVCVHCGQGTNAPCSTIQAIARELGVDDRG